MVKRCQKIRSLISMLKIAMFYHVPFNQIFWNIFLKFIFHYAHSFVLVLPCHDALLLIISMQFSPSIFTKSLRLPFISQLQTCIFLWTQWPSKVNFFFKYLYRCFILISHLNSHISYFKYFMNIQNTNVIMFYLNSEFTLKFWSQIFQIQSSF